MFLSTKLHIIHSIESKMPPRLAVLSISTLITILIGVLCMSSESYLLLWSSVRGSICSISSDRMHGGRCENECAGKPHHSTWASWWHPSDSGRTPASSSHGTGAITKDWNILYHLGGNGPCVEKVIDGAYGGIAVPENCEVEQIHMVCQHFSLPTT